MGVETTLTVRTPGTLYLKVNESAAGLSDNAGQIEDPDRPHGIVTDDTYPLASNPCPALPSVLFCAAVSSTDGRAGARMKSYAVFRELEKVNLFLSTASEFVAISGHS